jgi:hypothetical protein
MKDKILFWMDTDFTQYCLSYYLQQHSDYEMFAILDVPDKPKKFFSNQKLVNFQKIWFYFDNIKKIDREPDLQYLSKFEQKYSIDLWKLSINERILFRYNNFYKFSSKEILLILEQECKFFETVMDEIKPDFIIMGWPTLHHKQLFYELAKSRGIKTHVLFPTKIGTRSSISSTIHEIDFKTESNNTQFENITFEELQKIFNSSNFSGRVKKTMNQLKNKKSIRIKSAISFLSTKNSNLKTHYTYYGRTKFRVLIHELNQVLRKKIRHSFINKNFIQKPNFEKPFIYFPLHTEPEHQTLISTPLYTNQIEFILQIAKSMPINFELYVKEHIAQGFRFWRTTSFYKELLEIPNVKLIHPEVINKKIYEHCSLVITLAGSSSFEAAFFGKPSIVMGNLDYTILPSVYKIQGAEDLSETIKKCLETKVNPSDILKYITMVKESSFEFDQLGFTQKFHDFFFFEGNLVDVDITENQMNEFLNQNKDEFCILAKEYLKKLNDRNN